MSSLWTPGGERPVPREPGSEPEPTGPGAAPTGREPTEEEMQAEMEALREQLASTPAAIVVANHAYGLFELAALHLSLNPPQLDEARLAIDALGYVVEGLGERLGEPAGELEEALGQLRMAYVQMHAVLTQSPPGQAAPDPAGSGEPASGPGGGGAPAGS